MILKELRIKNFRSYCGDNPFTFKDGLTLIIGGNGDGKTTFFDALYWLFTTGIEDKNPNYISAKRLSTLKIGESDEVCVSLKFEHDGEKLLEKKFRFEMTDRGIITRNYSFQGYEISGSERNMVTGNILLERCFDAVVRKYCLFKGESELDVFDNPSALKTLVDTFSDIRKFDTFVEYTGEFEKKADTAYKKELNSDEKASKKAKILDAKIQLIKNELSDVQSDIREQEKVANAYRLKVDQLEKHQEESEKYHEIKERLQSLSEKRAKMNAYINENYNTKLLDDFWVLCAFPNVFREYQKKVGQLSRDKRVQNEAFIEERGKAKGKQEAIKELTALANGSARLPWYAPSKEIMEEMLDEQICKVCGRPAPKGSEPYNFMKEKLEEYLREEEKKNSISEKADEQPLFPNKYIEELHNISIANGGIKAKEICDLEQRIKDYLQFVSDRKADLKKIETEIEATEAEKQRLLIQADGLSEDMLEKDFKDIRGFFDEKQRAESRISDLRSREKDLLLQLDDVNDEYSALTPSSGMVQVYAKVHTAFEKINKAFQRAKESNLRSFLDGLETKANSYLEMLNVDDFHGIIKIRQTADDSARIMLYSSDGNLINDPNGALSTTMYMSVLFAISDMTTLKREVDYPLIFDAPTSSFESFKEDEFYNIIDGINKQCIIVTKDFLDKDPISGERKLNLDKIEQLTCSVYRIEKERPFDASNLSTIKTVSTQIK